MLIHQMPPLGTEVRQKIYSTSKTCTRVPAAEDYYGTMAGVVANASACDTVVIAPQLLSKYVLSIFPIGTRFSGHIVLGALQQVLNCCQLL